jgi:ubiquinone/menaquinone biosynthesis C-methylase UbiE
VAAGTADLIDAVIFRGSRVRAESVAWHYDNVPEVGRFREPAGQLEFERSKQIISRYLQTTPMKIVDIGAGVGSYSFWLAQMGHSVTAIEPSEKQLQIMVERNNQESRKLVRISNGYASKIELPDATFDIGLCMGPMYHLCTSQERSDALKEIKRVLKPEGLLVCAYISRFASLMDGYFRDFVEDSNFVGLVKVDLQTGVHDPGENMKYFTKAYLHSVKEIEPELSAAGFEMEHLFAVESFFWCLPSLGRYLQDPDLRAQLEGFVCTIEEDETLMGSSAHLLSISRARQLKVRP